MDQKSSEPAGQRRGQNYHRRRISNQPQTNQANRGNRTDTARDLGVDVRTVFRYLERARELDGTVS